MDEGWFEELIRTVLLDNPHGCEVVMVPSHTVGEERRERDARELERIAASWSERSAERVKAEQAALDAWQASPDSPEALATLPKLELSDISPEPEHYPTALDELGGVTLLRHELPALGISYVSLYFDITGLSGEETAAVSFLGELFGKVDTAGHSAQELSSLLQLYCGSMNFSVDVYEQSADKYCAKLTARVSAIESKIDRALEPAGRSAHHQPPGLRARDNGHPAPAPHRHAPAARQQRPRLGLGRAASQFTAGSAANEWANGCDYYCWLKRLTPRRTLRAVRQLAELSGRVIGRRGLTVSVTGMRSEAVDEAMAALVAALPEGETVSGAGVAPRGVRREGIEIPSDVGYAAMGGLSGEFDGRWQLGRARVSSSTSGTPCASRAGHTAPAWSRA